MKRPVPFAVPAFFLLGGWGAFIDTENLTNRRDPVTESELGDAIFYRLPGRRVVGTASYGF